MDAIISGRAGVALLTDGSVCSSFDVDDPDTLLPRRQSDAWLLFGEATDLVRFENVDHARAAEELEQAFNCASALDLALILLDADLPDDIRTDAADELEQLLLGESVGEYLENILYGSPLPVASDIAGALAQCVGGRLPKLSAVLQILEAYQPAIRDVSRAWDALPASLFGGDEQRAEFQRVAVRAGLFRQLANDVANGPRGRVEQFMMRALLNSDVKEQRNHRTVLQQWTGHFRTQAAAPAVRYEVEDFLEEAPPRYRGGRGRRKRKSAKEELSKLQGQFVIITAAMKRRDLVFARKITDEVIDYQLKTTRPIHVAMTLCNLATEAKALGIYQLQLEFTERAIQIAPDDGWSWAQYADALLRSQRPAEALNAYNQAESFGAGLLTGEPITKTGRAETLRALGRLPEALAAYDATLAEHPENAVAKAGRAETLKAMGRLTDALAAYDAIVAEHPESVVAKNGRAETLKAMGRLNEALAAYDAILVDNPYNSVAKSGRTGILVALRRYDEAFKSLPNVNPVTLDDWIGYHIRGMIMLRTDKIDSAIKVFEHGANNDPIPSSREYFRNALAVACLRRGDFQKAEITLEAVSMPLLQPQANVLRLHAFGARGKDASAAAAYEKLEDKPWFIPDELVAELHRRYILKEQPRHDDAWVCEQEEDTLLLDPSRQVLSISLLAA